MAKEAEVTLKIKVEVGNADKDLKKVTDQGKGLGKALTTIAGAKASQAIIGFAKDAVESFASFEDSMLRVKAVTGATGEEYKKMTQMALDAAKTTRYSAVEAGNAMYFMGQAGWNAQESMEALKGTLALASAEGMSLEQATRIITESVVAFNLKAKDAGHIADVLAQASISSNVSVAELGTSLEGAAAASNVFGFTLEDTITVLAVMAKHGVRGARAATSLRSGMLRLASPTEKAAEAMKDIGLKVFDAKGNMKPLITIVRDLQKALGGLSDKDKTEAINKIFGKQAVTGWMALINTSTKDLDKMSKAIENSGGQAKKMQDTMNSGSGGGLAKFQNAIKGLKISLGKSFSDILLPVLNGITDFLNALQPIMPVLGPIIAIITIFLGVLAVLGTIVSAVGFLLPVLEAGFAILATPVGIAIAVILALLFVFKLLVDNWDSIQKAFSDFGKWFGEIWDEAVKEAGESLNWLKDLFVNTWTSIQLAFNGVINFIIKKWQSLVGVLQGLGNFIIQTFRNVWDSVVAGFRSAMNNWIVKPWNVVVKFVNDLPLPFKIGKMNYFAKGTIATGPTNGVIGEAGPEAVVPLNTKNISRFMEAAATKGYTPSGVTTNNGPKYNLTVNANKVDGPSIERYINFMSRRDGW